MTPDASGTDMEGGNGVRFSLYKMGFTPVSSGMASSAPTTYTLIVDANVLYTPRQDRLISPEFEEALADCRKLAAIRLIVPRPALLEHLFTKIWHAKTQLNDAEGKMKAINALAPGYSRPSYDFDGNVLPPNSLWRCICRNAIRWCRANEVKVLRTPIKSINWNAIIRASIWRLPPFSPYDPKAKHEKGFRDALILESILEVHRSKKTERTAFVSDDLLLRETAAARIAGQDTFVAHASISEFLSSLRLLEAHISRLFSDVLLRKAPLVFYTTNDPESLFYKSDLITTLEHRFSYYLNFPHVLSEHVEGTVYAITPFTDESVIICEPIFERLGENGRFHWRTILIMSVGFLTHIGDAEMLRQAYFEIFWSCGFDKAGISSAAKVDESKWVAEIVGPAENEKMAKAGLPVASQRSMYERTGKPRIVDMSQKRDSRLKAVENAFDLPDGFLT